MFFIYGAENSKACDKAEFMLYTLGVQYRLYIFGRDYTLKQLQRLIPGTETVPHIYHGAKYVGGIKELGEYLKNEEVIYESRSEYERSKKILEFLAERREGRKGDIHED